MSKKIQKPKAIPNKIRLLRKQKLRKLTLHYNTRSSKAFAPSISFLLFSPTSRVQTDRRRPSRHSTPPMPLRWSSSPLPSIQTATAPPLPSAQGFAFTYLRAESTPPLPSARGPASRPPSNSPVGHTQTPHLWLSLRSSRLAGRERSSAGAISDGRHDWGLTG